MAGRLKPDPLKRRRDLVLLGTQVQVAVAVLSVAVALLALATGLGATGLGNFTVFGGVLLVGGLVLLAAAYRPLRLSWWQWLFVAGAGIAGTAASLLIRYEAGCCLFSFHVRSGYPFDFTGWSLGFDEVVTPAQAYAAARQRPHDIVRAFDAVPMAADALFWAYAGLLLVMPGRQLTRLVTHRTGIQVSDELTHDTDQTEPDQPDQTDQTDQPDQTDQTDQPDQPDQTDRTADRADPEGRQRHDAEPETS